MRKVTSDTRTAGWSEDEEKLKRRLAEGFRKLIPEVWCCIRKERFVLLRGKCWWSTDGMTD